MINENGYIYEDKNDKGGLLKNPKVAKLETLPEGWYFMSGTLTQPNGWLWASNRKSIRSGERKTALVRDPAYK